MNSVHGRHSNSSIVPPMLALLNVGASVHVRELPRTACSLRPTTSRDFGRRWPSCRTVVIGWCLAVTLISVIGQPFDLPAKLNDRRRFERARVGGMGAAVSKLDLKAVIVAPPEDLQSIFARHQAERAIGAASSPQLEKREAQLFQREADMNRACWKRAPKHEPRPWPLHEKGGPQNATIDDMFRVIQQPRKPLRQGKAFGTCAVIGSSNELVGRGLGRVIDGFDAVIRINRFPNSDMLDDFGRRTTHLTANCKVRREGPQSLFDNSTWPCHSGAPCNFKTVVFKGVCDHAEPMHPSWLTGQYRVMETGKKVQKTFERFSRGRCVLSTGLVTILSFMPLCERIRLFGFGDPRGVLKDDTASVDRHSDGPHWLDWEHEVLTYLFAKRTSPMSHGSAEAAGWWLTHPWMRAKRPRVEWE